MASEAEHLVTAPSELIRDAIASTGDALPFAERYCLAVLAGWAVAQAASAGDGDLDSVSYGLRRRFRAMTRLIASVRGKRHRCNDTRCHDTHGCCRGQARARAAAAHLVIVNHALWLSPALDSLPACSGLLLDEAHDLEDAATSALTEEFTDRTVYDVLAELLAPGDRSGLLPRIWKRTTAGTSPHDVARSVASVVRLVYAESVVFGTELATFLKRIGLAPADQYGARYRLRATGKREHPAR